MCATTVTAHAQRSYLNGNNPDDRLLKVLACLLLYLESNQVIISWKVSKRNYKDWKPNFLLSLPTLLEFYLHLQTLFLILSSYRF